MKQNWPYCGVALGAAMLAWTVWVPPTLGFEYALRAQFIALVLHQFEEYVRPGGFTEFYNHQIYRRSPLTQHPLGPFGVYSVNIFWGWGLYGIVCFIPNLALLGIGLAVVHLVNGGAHLALSIKMKAYNPGVVSGVVLLFSTGIWAVWSGLPALQPGVHYLLVLAPPLAIFVIHGSIFIGAKMGSVPKQKGT